MDTTPERGLIDGAITAYVSTLLTPARFRAVIDGALNKLIEFTHTMDRDKLAQFFVDEAKAQFGITSATRPLMLGTNPTACVASFPDHAFFIHLVRRRLVVDAVAKGMTPLKALLAIDHVTDSDIMAASDAQGVERAAISGSGIWDWIKTNWKTILQVSLSLLGLVLMFAEAPVDAPPPAAAA